MTLDRSKPGSLHGMRASPRIRQHTTESLVGIKVCTKSRRAHCITEDVITRTDITVCLELH